MPFIERITNRSSMLAWSDHLPLQYKYSLGVMGEKFSKAIREGRLVAAHCDGCGRSFIPPAAYCTKCFRKVSGVVDVDQSTGTVYTYTSKQGRTLVAVKFEGVEGVLIHLYAQGAGEPSIGQKVKPAFKPASKRVGSIQDIEWFEPKR